LSREEEHQAADLVQRCEELIGTIDIPQPFDMQALCDELGKLWGSTVVLCPADVSRDQPCGLWVSVPLGERTYDVFIYDKNAPVWHQAQMIFHEIGHRLCGHPGATELPLTTKELLMVLMPNLNPDIVEQALACAREPTAYDRKPEMEAEYIGARLLDRAFGWRAGPLSAADAGGLTRLHSALGSASGRRT
jgi:hypothetical protein